MGVREELYKIKFSAIGALFLEQVVAKLKRQAQQLTEQSLSSLFRDLEAVFEVLQCMNVQDIKDTLEDKVREGDLDLEEMRKMLM